MREESQEAFEKSVKRPPGACRASQDRNVVFLERDGWGGVCRFQVMGFKSVESVAGPGLVIDNGIRQ